MPNYCEYEMKIKGSKEALEEFIKLDDYEIDNHFYRMFGYENTGIEQVEGDIYETVIYGDCAWSICTCCIDGYPDKDLFAYHTGRLNLTLECFSREPGMCFEEHYIYVNGVCALDETEEYYEYYMGDYTAYEELLEEYPNTTITREQFNDADGNYIGVGGFADEDGYWEYNI